ncbi:hypothetical protein FD755_011162 [Muntiacus reevesi]|uniref:TNFR-Cys domain-containing protein n=1 Tax=Muntiacus reevesi TaxID=9886 RepID=A0A5N3XRT7_MUNRE|nr:hypothetical protein FD755_011162 [Muntiacus reevesi]
MHPFGDKHQSLFQHNPLGYILGCGLLFPSNPICLPSGSKKISHYSPVLLTSCISVAPSALPSRRPQQCPPSYLVEKKPCSRNSSRVCECRAGMFCGTSVVNSCARCIPHSVCPAGMVVKLQGTAQRDTVCEPASRGASPNCSASLQDCKGPTSGAISQAKTTLTSPASPGARTMLLGGGIPLTPEDASKMTPNSSSFVGKLNPDPGLTLQPPCPQGSADCRKQCNHDYYLDRDGRCKACVTCSGDGLVEKTPCTWNSSRVCECQPGMFCATPVTNSCARCVTRPNCPPGTVTKLQGKQQLNHQQCKTNQPKCNLKNKMDEYNNNDKTCRLSRDNQVLAILVQSPLCLCLWKYTLSVGYSCQVTLNIKGQSASLQPHVSFLRKSLEDSLRRVRLCNPTDCSPPGSSEHGIFQARILDGPQRQSVSTSLRGVRLFATPWIVACQTPLSMGLSREEYWSGESFSSPGDLPAPEMEPGSPALQADSLPSELPGKLPFIPSSLLFPLVTILATVSNPLPAGMAETGATSQAEPPPPGSPPDCSTSPEDRGAPAR